MVQERDPEGEVRRLLLDVDEESPTNDIALAIEIHDEEPGVVLARLLETTVVGETPSP